MMYKIDEPCCLVTCLFQTTIELVERSLISPQAVSKMAARNVSADPTSRRPSYLESIKEQFPNDESILKIVQDQEAAENKRMLHHSMKLTKPDIGYNPKLGMSIHDQKFRIFWLVLSLVGMVVHSIFVTIDYFKYTTTTEVFMTIESEFVPPAFSICFKPEDIRIPEKFPHESLCSKQFLSQEDKWICEESLANYTFREVMMDLTYNLSDSVSYIAYGDRKIYGERIFFRGNNHAKHLTQFYFNMFKCLRIRMFDNNTKKLLNSDLSKLDFLMKVFMDISGKDAFKSFMDRISQQNTLVYYFFSDSESHPRGFDVKYYHEKLALNHTGFDFAYKKFEYEYLPAPYFSMCTEYNERNLESREHCIDHCIKGRLLIEYGESRAVRQAVYTSDEILAMSQETSFEMLYDLDYERKILSSYHGCKSKCPLGCTSTFYETEFIRKYIPYEINSVLKNVGYFYELTHRNIASKLVFSPKLDTLSYFIYLSSIFSLWLGFVIFDSLKLITSMIITKHYEYINRTRIQRNQINPSLKRISNIHLNLVINQKIND